MVLCEDLDCSVCFQRYSRSKHIPRVLYCNHTFCAPCLEKIALQQNGMLTVRCPLCRQVSCVRRGVALQEALWIDSSVWGRIAESQVTEEESTAILQALAPAEEECGLRATSKHTRPKLQLPSFLKKLSFTRQPEERIVPAGNVRIKSWRRL
ncbi:RING finger protein 208 isoform X1 [Electrophorus electricus]|uniref:RING finger protein 208 isoform X1 n=2 Tax=Electrophorus electricus TaxID=8005 RepID=UPI0015CFE541|nr:RING finger protein 208 isoform X1 [Electrophorus electricus]